MNQTTTLKHALPQYLKAIGHQPEIRQSKLSARCPLHSDTNPSFTADLKNDGWMWFCHACGVGGDIFTLHAKRRELDPQKDFGTVWNEVSNIFAACPSPKKLVSDGHQTGNVSEAGPEFDPLEFLRIAQTFKNELGQNAWWRSIFASHLGIHESIFLQASQLPGDGLGIAMPGTLPCPPGAQSITIYEPRLVYIGDGYYKVRSPFGAGAKSRFWLTGKPRRPWLSDSLAIEGNQVRDVHIHESESSALALIASGFWAQDGSSIVVAANGANGFKKEWAPLFANRTMHFWPDADDAGQRFVDNTAQLLLGTAGRILVHHWSNFLPR